MSAVPVITSENRDRVFAEREKRRLANAKLVESARKQCRCEVCGCSLAKQADPYPRYHACTKCAPEGDTTTQWGDLVSNGGAK